MKYRFLLGLFVLFSVAAEGRKDDETRKDQDKIQGTWAFVGIEEAKVKKTERQLKGFEDRLHWTFNGTDLTRNLGDEPVRGHFKLDASKQPREITLFNYAGKGKTVHGIYAFEGEHLKIFLGSAERGERPTTFRSPPAAGQVLFLMKRYVVQNKDS